MPHLADVPTRRSVLPPGDAGTDATVAEMAKVAMGVFGAQSPKIRALTISILRDARTPNKDYAAYVRAVHAWILRKIQYVRDPVNQESLSHPEYTLQLEAGDCDDMATLEAAMLGSVGIPTRFVVVGMTPNTYSHVYLHANAARRPGEEQWIPLDPIMREKPVGWEVPSPARKKLYNVNHLLSEGHMNGLGNELPGSIFDIPVGTPTSTYIGDPRLVKSPLSKALRSPQENDNYVITNAADNGANDPSWCPPAANDPSANLPSDTKPGWKRGPKQSFMMLQGLGGEGFAKIQPQFPVSRPDAYMQVPALAAAPEGPDSIFGRPAQLVQVGPDNIPTPVQAYDKRNGLFQGIPKRKWGPRSMAGRTAVRPISLGEDAPAPSNTKKYLIIGAIALGALFLLRKKA